MYEKYHNFSLIVFLEQMINVKKNKVLQLLQQNFNNTSSIIKEFQGCLIDLDSSYTVDKNRRKIILRIQIERLFRKFCLILMII